jgi:hypothetical protein
LFVHANALSVDCEGRLEAGDRVTFRKDMRRSRSMVPPNPKAGNRGGART